MYSLWTGERSMIDRTKLKRGDASYIGEELLEGVNETYLQCESIKYSQDRKILSLKIALKVYEVTEEDYNLFLEGKMKKFTDGRPE